MASFNVLNLDPTDDAQKFDNLAAQIVDDLNTPDIIGLQEIQDNNGPTDDGTVDADQTLQALIDAIADAGGPTYQYVDNPPVDGDNGGQPGGNIRNAFLYDPSRVTLTGPTGQLPGADLEPAFDGGRDPLVATFAFNGETLTLINNHFSSKAGSDPLFGEDQPPLNGGETAVVGDPAGRIPQAQFVNDYVDTLLAGDPDAHVIVLGDLNEFQFEDALLTLQGMGGDQVLHNLVDLISDDTDKYSFVFEGNSQLLDHILASHALQGLAEYDIVHTNTGFAYPTQLLTSDHDPLVARFEIPEPASLAILGVGSMLVLRRRRAA